MIVLVMITTMGVAAVVLVGAVFGVERCLDWRKAGAKPAQRGDDLNRVTGKSQGGAQRDHLGMPDRKSDVKFSYSTSKSMDKNH